MEVFLAHVVSPQQRLSCCGQERWSTTCDIEKVHGVTPKLCVLDGYESKMLECKQLLDTRFLCRAVKA